jgi:hypothetical protein
VKVVFQGDYGEASYAAYVNNDWKHWVVCMGVRRWRWGRCLFNCDNHNMFSVLERRKVGEREFEWWMVCTMKLVSWNVRGLGWVREEKGGHVVGWGRRFRLSCIFKTLSSSYVMIFYVSHCGVMPLVLFLISRLLRRQEVC